MPVWYNADGLLIKTGRDEAVTGNTGQYGTPGAGNQHVVETTLTLNTLTTTAAIVDDYTRFPKGFRLSRVEVLTETPATSGGAATLDFGFVAADRVTEVDHDGLVAALPLSAINTAGKRSTLDVGVAGAGALVGTIAPAAAGAYLTARAGTAVYTGGSVKVRIYFYKP